jgi:hypothetical protein
MLTQTLKFKGWLVASLALVAVLAVAQPALAAAHLGISSFSMSLSSPQAGAHADETTAFTLDTNEFGNPTSELKGVTVTLPPGAVGNPQGVPHCSLHTFEDFACPADTQIGYLQVDLVTCEGATALLAKEAVAGATTISVANAEQFCQDQDQPRTITIGTGAAQETATVTGIEYENYEYASIPKTVVLAAPLQHTHAAGETIAYQAELIPLPTPLFNLTPQPGHDATFGSEVLVASLLVNVDVPDGGNGGLQATISDASTDLNAVGATMVLWGVPAEPSHDPYRCPEFLNECGLHGGEQAAFMTNPTACPGTPLQGALTVESYGHESATETTTIPPLTGCEALKLAPSIAVAPDTTQRDTPAGYEVDLKVPQSQLPEELATPDVKDVSVTLPAGTSLSPAMASGLQACSETQFTASNCPNASKIGTAELTTPLLADKLTGSIDIGEPSATEEYPLRVLLSDGTTTIRLYGRADPNPSTGQVTAVFENAPELPFNDLKLNLFGGPTAALANPTACGPATSSSQITSYGGQLATPTSEFTVANNDGDESCPAAPSFAPHFSAGTTSPQAAGFSPFTLTVSRTDGEPSLSSFDVELPPGLLGLLKSVPLCLEPLAAQGKCAQSSEVGTATILAGAGSQPLPVSGPVYLTGPYDGAPFGLAVVVNATAGPFNLGTAVIRSRIYIAPNDLHLTIVSDPFPQIMGGIPLRLQTVNVTFDRSAFMFNPSGCGAETISGTIGGVGGASAAVSSPFQVAGCEDLPFTPSLTATTQAGASSRGNGAGLVVKIANPAQSAANMRTASIEMPAQLRPRLATIQHACLAATTLSTPSACPPESLVGHASVTTPVMVQPLTGPVYLVAHGGTAPPSLVLLLEGEGVSVSLTAALSISSKGPITAVFQSLPDVPISTFELTLPGGPHSMLGATANVCRATMTIPYKLTDQGGAVLKGSAAVRVSGCPKHRAVRRSAKSSRRRSARKAARDASNSGRQRPLRNPKGRTA